MKAAKDSGFGNGNSEWWVARCSLIPPSMDGRGFRAPSVGSFPRLFQSSRSNSRFHVAGPNWPRQACVECASAYSVAWAAAAFSIHHDQALDHCVEKLRTVLSSKLSIFNVETLSLAAIAINAAESNVNPFQVEDLK